MYAVAEQLWSALTSATLRRVAFLYYSFPPFFKSSFPLVFRASSVQHLSSLTLMRIQKLQSKFNKFLSRLSTKNEMQRARNFKWVIVKLPLFTLGCIAACNKKDVSSLITKLYTTRNNAEIYYSQFIFGTLTSYVNQQLLLISLLVLQITGQQFSSCAPCIH